MNGQQSIKIIRDRISNLYSTGFFHVFFGDILNKGVLMITSIALVRLLDTYTYAHISYADNLYSYITLVSGLGLANAILRCCLRRNGEELNLAYFKYAAVKGALINLLLSLVLAIAVSTVPIPYPEARPYTLALLLFQSLSHVLNSIMSFMRSNSWNKRYAYTGILHSILMLAATIIFTLSSPKYGFIAARYFAVGLALITAFFWIPYEYRNKKPQKLSKAQRKHADHIGLSIMTAILFSGIMPINEVFLVNNLIADETITAYFRVAGILPQFLIVITNAINVYFFTIIVNSTDKGFIRKTIIKASVINAMVIFPISALGMVFSPFVIETIYGKEYLNAVGMSYALWLMRALNAGVRSIPMNMMLALGREKLNAWIAFFSSLVQTILIYFLLKKAGVMGVTYGTITVYALTGLLYWVLIVHFTGKGFRNVEQVA